MWHNVCIIWGPPYTQNAASAGIIRSNGVSESFLLSIYRKSNKGKALKSGESLENQPDTFLHTDKLI